MPDISITAMTSVGMITLRGSLNVLCPAVESVTGCAAPKERMSTRSGAYTCIWMSPDELLIVCETGDVVGLVKQLETMLTGQFATVADVSDARQVFDLKGTGAQEMLAKLMPVDFAMLAPTEVRRTRMAQIPAAIWRHSDGFHLVCFRSVSDYAMALLENARPINP